MKAIWRNQVIAESAQTVAVDGFTYFPRAAVRMDLLVAAPRTAEDRECPHAVRFYDVVTEHARGERIAWSYEQPHGALRQVEHWIGFWEDVELV